MTFKDKKEVEKLLAPIIKLCKSTDGKLLQPKYKNSIEHLPEYFPSYKELVSHTEAIRIHAEKGGFPENLFFERAPNMEDKEFKYMKINYKQNTLPVFLDFLSTNTRCFNDGNWNIQYQKDEDVYIKAKADFQSYVERKIGSLVSLENYTKSLIAHVKAIDANGIMAVKPKEVFYTDSENEGEEVIDTSKLLEPQPYYYPIRNCISDPKFDEQYIIVESCEKSSVKYRGDGDKIGHIFEVYDSENIWRVEQVGKFLDYNFEYTLYFNHNKKSVPAMRLMGIPALRGETLIWQSPFLFACDLLDLALMNENYLQCSLANVLFPYRVMLGSRCRYKYKCNDEAGTVSPCNDGHVFDSVSGEDINCPSCKGSGLLNRVSPLGQMLLFPEDMFTQGESKVSVKPYEVIDPSTGSSEFVVKKIDRDLLKAYDVLKVRPASQAKGTGIGKDGTATEAIFDEKAQMQAVKLFSDQIFTILEFLHDTIGWQRYAEAYKKPVISYPVSSDFYTESDYISLITQLQTAKVAPSILENVFKKYLRSLYYNEKVTANIFDLIIGTDRFFVFTNQDLLLKVKLGQAENWELILHDSATQFIDELIEEHKNAEMCAIDDCSSGFFALDFATQKQYLIQKAQAKSEAITSPMDAVPYGGGK